VARISLSTVVQGMQLYVNEASKPDEAYAALEEYRGEFGVAILDVNLRGASGIDLLRDIKQRDRSIEVIMVTGFETLETAKRALRLGACDFINKPFDVPNLENAVNRALRLHETSRLMRRRELELTEMLDDMGPAALEWVRIQRGIIHDVRNQLTVVASYHHHISTILGRLQNLGAEDTRSLKNQVDVVGRQLHSVVDVLNRQTNMWRPNDPGSRESANVAGILRDLVELVHRHPDAKLCTIDLDLESEDLRVPLATSDATEILLNLILNAAQSTFGRVKIGISARVVPLPLADAASPRGYEGMRRFGGKETPGGHQALRILVRDTGSGISQDLLVRLVKEQVSTKGSRGTGLGMGVVAEAITRNQGVFTIRSTVNRGTEVEVLLPTANGNGHGK
jgi:FixJ family two-component response regulator